MADKPYKIYDRRGTVISSNGNNRLIPAATPNFDRKQPSDLGFDIHRNISTHGLKKLRDWGQSLFWSFPLVNGAVIEKAEMSVGSMIREFAGSDESWGAQAVEMLYESDENFSVRGWPFNNTSYRINQLIANATVGDSFTLLTETLDGDPRIQVIGAHRIASFASTVSTSDPFRPPTIFDRQSQTWMDYTGATNPWAGYKIDLGVILNEYGMAVAYRVYDDPPISFVDISANSLFPTFIPVTEDQYRGIPELAVSAPDWGDVKETRDFEKLVQKTGASIPLVEWNEAGEPAPGVAEFGDSSSSCSTSSGIYSELIEGGTIRYLRSNTGAKIEAIKTDRPTMNQQAFEDRLIDGCFYSLGWSRQFTLNPEGLSGGPARIMVEKINRTRERCQAMSEKCQRRIDAFKISKYIKNGQLPPNPDALKWEYHWSARITADQKYDDEIMRERIKLGLGTYTEAYGRRNLDPKQQIRLRFTEQKMFQDLSAELGVPIETVQLLAQQQLQIVQGQNSQD